MISIIVACDKNGLIGSKGTIPWHLPEDLKLFKKITDDSIVIMGRNTWQSIPAKFRPLQGRINIVVSTLLPLNDDCSICKTLSDAIEFAKYLSGYTEPKRNIFIIGGEKLYKEAIRKKYVSRLYISHVEGEFTGDTYFNFDTEEWKIEEEHRYKGFTAKVYSPK